MKKKEKEDIQNEIIIYIKALKYGIYAAIILTSLYYFYLISEGYNVNLALYAIFAILCAVSSIYQTINSKRNQKFNIFISIFWLLITLFLIIVYFI